MQKHSDEALVAYLDGELDDVERRHVEAWLDAEPSARERLGALAQSADLLRSAYADIVSEPVPERLIAAARGETQPAAQEAEILVLRRPRRAAAVPQRRWQIGLAAAAGLFGVVFGGAGTYLGMGILGPANPAAGEQLTAAATNAWLDNAAAYYKLTVNAGDNMLIDVPATNDPREALQKISQNLPQQVRLPDLKPWGLTFRGARLVVVEGKPAAQLVYVTDNKAIGPLTLIIGTAKQPDEPPTFDHRQGVNLLYWRHNGRAYALVGRADIGYLWGIANDVAWQLDAI
ncbi:MAG TPA: anti-sigma factor [Stellaceae bacterium]|nr:anti-sigma factor [Stellaceae bacterium]